ncbi:MAG TPA: hypothetical protein VE913_13560, partial [Longimicrobium sp.]|nr:hypothetical protein [Longimicrobium sp.]
GLVYQLFTDTGAENMMDDEPFVTVDLGEVAREQIEPNALDALVRLRRGTFDPAHVGADARRKMHVAAYAEALERILAAPDERFVRVMMDVASIEGRRTGRALEEHGALVREAAESMLDRKILQRVGFAERGDLVRVRGEQSGAASPPTEPAAPTAPAPGEAGVVTTDVEAAVFAYVRGRLPFLIERDEALFASLEHLRAVDHKTVFCVYYKQERKGRIFNFREGAKSPHYRFDFAGPDGSVAVDTDDLADIDAPLLSTFMARVTEMG